MFHKNLTIVQVYPMAAGSTVNVAAFYSSAPGHYLLLGADDGSVIHSYFLKNLFTYLLIIIFFIFGEREGRY